MGRNLVSRTYRLATGRRPHRGALSIFSRYISGRHDTSGRATDDIGRSTHVADYYSNIHKIAALVR